MLGALVLLGALAVAPYVPRNEVPASAPADVFSAERALPHLRAIAREPHPVGSPANARVRDYLLGQLAALGLRPEVQRAAVFRAPTGDGVVVENVLVRLPGSASTGVVLLTAHYDSVNSAPGAGDDGMAVAALVETLRALRAGPPLGNDLIVLFDDGEEPEMYGAQTFVERHPWATDVRVVFDFDADSPTGPTTILWTTPGDGWLPGAVALIGVALLGAGVATSGFSPAQPRPDTLLYGRDADTEEAYWITLDPQPDEWTGQFLAGATRRTLDELVGGGDPVPVLVAPAPVATLPPPSLTVESQELAGDVRTLRLRLASPRRAGRLHLLAGPDTRIVAANLGDAPPAAIEGNEVLISGLPAEGIALSVQMRASGPVRFTVVDRSTGLPGLPGLPTRPATVMSAPVGEDLSGYPTLVRASFTIPPAEERAEGASYGTR
jgi:hypothetical protein